MVEIHTAQTLSGVCGLNQWTHVEEWVGTWLRPWKARAADGLKVWGFRPEPRAPAQAGVQQADSFPPRPHLIGLAPVGHTGAVLSRLQGCLTLVLHLDPEG